MASLHQGDILKIEKIKHPVLVVSKDFFNTSGEIIGCPIIKNSTAGPLHIWMSTEENEGYIQCEKLALLDMSFRGYKKVDRLPISEMVNISDAIQGIFEYVQEIKVNSMCVLGMRIFFDRYAYLAKMAKQS